MFGSDIAAAADDHGVQRSTAGLVPDADALGNRAEQA
jgi:hypothetical protein